ncbi:MAG: FAD-binding protein [Chloroflexi bacterium]|nr:FAD-binding protein [Chloroflexota bacterium]
MTPNHPEAIEATHELIRDLGDAVEHTAFDQMTRLIYSTDASIYQMMPVGVAFPRHEDEVCAAVEITRKHNVPILPRGGGSSLCGNAIGHALILDFSRHMDRILDIDTEQQVVKTQPGITLGALNQALAKHKLMYGPDPASGDRATMGGIMGNNSTGAHSIVYGMTHDHVLSTDVVLSDGSQVSFSAGDGDWNARFRRSGLEGSIYKTVSTVLAENADEIAKRYPNTFRHVAGYNLHLLAQQENPNLAQLMVGSEGTLGIMTEASLKLVPVPKVKRLAMVHFSSLRAAMEAVPTLLESSPTAVEVLDKMLLDLTRDKFEYRRLLTFVEGDPQIVLLIEYAGDSEAELDHGIQLLNSKLREINHADPVVFITDPKQQANVWYVRKVGLGILMSVRGDAKPVPFIEDAAVPVEHLAEYISEIYDYCYNAGLEQVAMYAHASAGCIHVRPLVNLKNETGVRQLRQIAEKSVELVLKFNGTTSGEHGEGIVRSEFSEQLFGTKLTQAFKTIKAAFDPDNRLNPGKVVDPPRMDDESLMRYGSQYAVPNEPQNTVFGFLHDGGFARSVEMCNGAGVCRKLGQGVMCPSFQVTRDENHSTRGRANALRAAMMGLLGIDGMTSKQLYDVFDLCISCHACKSECPSSVDMARLKAEFTHQYYQEHGIPLRARLFANISQINKLTQPIAPLVNAVLNGSGKWLLTILGVHPNRSMPQLSSQTFSSWYRKNGMNGSSGKQVVFFHDTFMEYNDPQVGQAAIKVLKAAGYDPIVLFDKKDSGRPAVSKGLLIDAVKLAHHNLKLLAPYAKQGIPIVGCEPSVMAMLVDEYPDLVPGENAEAVAGQTMMLETLILRGVDAGDLSLEYDQTPRQILYHGHCQQKATFGTEDTIKLLELIPNCQVKEIDSGCCGMAGSFGYEKEHYDMSVQLAEMTLAPAVRAADKDTIICASGTSCRDQIAHSTDRKALHAIEIFADSLK